MLTRSPNTLAWQIALTGLDVRLGQPGALENLRKLVQREPLAKMALAQTEAVAGHREEALRLIRPLEQAYKPGQTAVYQFALFYAELDDEPNTVKWLKRALEVRDNGVIHVRVEPAFAKMQNTPDFHRLKKRVGIDW